MIDGVLFWLQIMGLVTAFALLLNGGLNLMLWLIESFPRKKEDRDRS